MADPWLLVAGIAAVSMAIRLVPELLLHGRPPPKAVADSLPWLPVTVSGTLLGVLHFDVPDGSQLPYLAAGVVAAATLLWRRIRNAVRDYRDLESSFVGAVEQLLDFLLTPPQD